MSGVNDDCYVHYYIQQGCSPFHFWIIFKSLKMSFLSTFAPAVKKLMTAHSGWVWGKTPEQSVLKRYCQSNYRGRGLHPCDVTQRLARFEKGVKILVDLKKKHWVDFYHYRVVVYTHCQHTFQFKQLVKAHVALDEPYIYICNRGWSFSFSPSV